MFLKTSDAQNATLLTTLILLNCQEGSIDNGLCKEELATAGKRVSCATLHQNVQNTAQKHGIANKV